MDSELMTTRRAQLVAEREQAMLRQILSDRQAAQQIERLNDALSRAYAAREVAQANWEKSDHAYGAVIGELDRLLKQDEVKEDPDGL